MAGSDNVSASQNISWTVEKGSWLVHFIITFVIWIILSEIVGSSQAWQLTVIIYNLITFIFFHWIVGDPFSTEFREFTFWEQMAVQLGHSSTLIFMSVYPVFLFMFASRMAEWSTKLFCVAVVSLILVVVPKLGFMHMKRLFGIKKHN